MQFAVRTLAPDLSISSILIDALDEADARRQAEARGLFVSAVERSGGVRLARSRAPKLSLVLFSQDLLALLSAGLGIVEGLEALLEKESNPAARGVLERLLAGLREGQVMDGNTILIYPNSAAKLKEYQELTVKTFYLANADAKSIANTFKTILKSRDVVVDEKLNLVILRDSPEAVKLATQLVALQDVPEPEVMLDVEVLEVKRSRIMDLGVAWPQSLEFTPLIAASGARVSIDELRGLNSSVIGVAGVRATVHASHGRHRVGHRLPGRQGRRIGRVQPVAGQALEGGEFRRALSPFRKPRTPVGVEVLGGRGRVARACRSAAGGAGRCARAGTGTGTCAGTGHAGRAGRREGNRAAYARYRLGHLITWRGA